MAGLDLLVIQDQITAKVKAILPNTLVVEDGIVDDQLIPRDPNNSQQMLPYVVLRYNSLRREGVTGYSMGGVRWDQYYSTVDVDVVAPVGRVARNFMNLIVDQLVGWAPADSNYISTEGSANTYALPFGGTRPSTFLASIRLRYGVNTTGVGTQMPYPPV